MLETALLSRGFSPALLGVHLCGPRPTVKRNTPLHRYNGYAVLLGKQYRAGLLGAFADEFDHPLALTDVG